ncbi:MAG: hypothetical protein L0Y60_14165 [Beijerinckiaceae bacterium]|nr:hypothetical protein [Beijerinckiaceae bacterium]
MANLDVEFGKAVTGEGPGPSMEIFVALGSGTGSALSAATGANKTVAAARKSLT